MMSFSNFLEENETIINNLVEATVETIYMTIVVSIIVLISGTIIGFLLYALNNEKLFYNKTLYSILSIIVNVLRAIPFVILLILLIPVTKVIIGTILGPEAAIVPLSLSVAPFFARLVETACKEVNQGVIELGYSLGFKKVKILSKLVFKEALPAIFDNFTTTIISIISFTAMAGIIGAGGLGNLAYLSGYQGNDKVTMYSSVILILLIVFITQTIGKLVVKKLDKRRIK